MRAMEYTPAQCRCEMVDRWVLVHWCLIHGTQIEPTKKLTDAECAAEYWRAEADEQINLSTNEDDAGAVDAYRHIRGTWHRFATHPHASEEER